MQVILQLAIVLFFCSIAETLGANPPLQGVDLSVTTPLGRDVLILEEFNGEEAVSQLFSFHLELLAENETKIPFEAILGKEVSMTLRSPGEPERFFHGICSRITQGDRNSDLTSYRMEVVPRLWLLTQSADSRIFQQSTVPEILSQVLDGAGIDYEMQLEGDFHTRDYAVQYRETDFNFVSRLMEEEGIFYFFKHTEATHTMVIANAPSAHTDIESGPIRYDTVGIARPSVAVYQWEKTQEIRSSRYTLRDYHFQLPLQNLEVSVPVSESVRAGEVRHLLRLPEDLETEVYDYPGAYAQRFDGIDPAGGKQPAELQRILPEGQRTAAIRMEEETVNSVQIKGASTSPHLSSGHKFTLQEHFNADGKYLVTRVTHSIRRSGRRGSLEYSNSFECIPADLPYRPQRTTAKPVVQGVQTAIVVGPEGEEIFTDKYARVKVQFHWDREGKSDDSSSCWVRVGALNAGREFGVSFDPSVPYLPLVIPVIGQEVIVAFLEGDPDRPIIVVSVYNPEHLPPLYDIPPQ